MNIVSTAAQASALSSGNVFVRSAAVFVMSMLPFIENKGAIILAAALKLKWYLTYLLTCIGSYLPVPFLLRMKKHPLGQKETSPRLLRNAHQALEKHEAQLKKYGPPALLSACASRLRAWAAGLAPCSQGLPTWMSDAPGSQFSAVRSSRGY